MLSVSENQLKNVGTSSRPRFLPFTSDGSDGSLGAVKSCHQRGNGGEGKRKNATLTY